MRTRVEVGKEEEELAKEGEREEEEKEGDWGTKDEVRESISGIAVCTRVKAERTAPSSWPVSNLMTRIGQMHEVLIEENVGHLGVAQVWGQAVLGRRGGSCTGCTVSPANRKPI